MDDPLLQAPEDFQSRIDNVKNSQDKKDVSKKKISVDDADFQLHFGNIPDKKNYYTPKPKTHRIIKPQ